MRIRVEIIGKLVYTTIEFICSAGVKGDYAMGKVLFVATVVKTHIMQFHLPYLRMFHEMGWETAVAAKNDYEDPRDCQIPDCDTYFNIPFHRIPWKKDNVASYRMLKRIIGEGDFDIVHCHTPVGAMIARLAARGARKKGTRVIYTAHGFHFFRGAPVQNWLMYYPAEWLLSFLTDTLITINKEDFARAKKHLHPKRLEYVPGVGIDIRRFQHTPRLEKRKELGFGDEDFLILTVAEMTKNKNHITVLKALAAIREQKEFSHMHYLICGRGEQWEKLEQDARALGIWEHVHFLGYRTDAPELYGACDLFAFMTYREGLPVSLMEAMAAGMPIVCTRVRGNTDLIQDGVSGVFVPNDPAALAESILSLYRSPDRRRALGAEAAEAVRPFGEETVHRKMREIYFG